VSSKTSVILARAITFFKLGILAFFISLSVFCVSSFFNYSYLFFYSNTICSLANLFYSFSLAIDYFRSPNKLRNYTNYAFVSSSDLSSFFFSFFYLGIDLLLTLLKSEFFGFIIFTSS